MIIQARRGGHLVARFKNPLMKSGWQEITLGTKNRAKAEQIAKDAKIAEMEAANNMGILSAAVYTSLVAGTRKLTIQSAIADYINWMENGVSRAKKTCDRNRESLNRFARVCNIADQPPMVITTEMVNHYVNDTAWKACAGHRTKTLQAIRGFCKFCNYKGYFAGNPAELVEVDFSKLTHEQIEVKKKPVITDDELHKILLAATPFWRVAVLIGRHTALRLADVCHFEWANMTADNIVRWTRKNDKRVVVPVHQQVFAALATVPKEHTVYCFPHERNEYDHNPAEMSRQFSQLCKKVGVVGKTFHCLRVTRASEIANTVGIEEARRQLGHGSVKTTQIYVRETTPSTPPETNKPEVIKAPDRVANIHGVAA